LVFVIPFFTDNDCYAYILILFCRYGQPPADIIKDIAPGLQLDEDGLPKMDGNAAGMPFPMGGDEDCRVM